MKYVVKYAVKNEGYRDASRLMAEMRAARRELMMERRKMRCHAL